MDPQQEIFSALLIALNEKYKNTGIGVYDTFLPPEGTAYPFVYLGATTQSDQNTKDAVIGNVSQTVHVWHDNPRKRGTVSQVMLDIKTLESMRHKIADVAQSIVTIPDVASPKLAGDYTGDLSTEYEYYSNAKYTIVVPVEVDGREVARTTAPYMQSELDSRQSRENRRRGRK